MLSAGRKLLHQDNWGSSHLSKWTVSKWTRGFHSPSLKRGLHCSPSTQPSAAGNLSKHWAADGQALLGCHCCPNVDLMKTRSDHSSLSYFPTRQKTVNSFYHLNQMHFWSIYSRFCSIWELFRFSVHIQCLWWESSAKFFSTAYFFIPKGEKAYFLNRRH